MPGGAKQFVAGGGRSLGGLPADADDLAQYGQGDFFRADGVDVEAGGGREFG